MQQQRRDYSMSDPELSSRGLFIINTVLDRDLADLADQGVDAMEVGLLQQARTNFINHPTDHQLLYTMKQATQQRDARGVEVLKIANQTISKAKFKWGEDDGGYLKYDLGAISQDSPSVRITKLKNMFDIATEQKADLLDKGMTDDWLLIVSDNIADYERLTQAQMRAVSNRRVAMVQRVKLGNIYYALLKNLADKGKLCWMYDDSGKHEDYVLYHHPIPGTQTIASDIPANDSVSHELVDVVGDTELTFTNEGLTDLNIFFDEDPMAESGSPHDVVLAGAVVTVTATSLGYDEAGGKTNFNVFNPGSVQGSYKVQWH